MTVCTVPVGVLCKCMGVLIVRCVSVGGMEGGREKLSGSCACRESCAGQPARWLPGCLPPRSLAVRTIGSLRNHLMTHLANITYVGYEYTLLLLP